MLVAVADTHALLWYLYKDTRLSATALQTFRSAVASGNRIGVSTISLAEIIYLDEKGRIPLGTLSRIDTAFAELASVLLELPLTRLVAMSLGRVARSQVPDMPDRIIAATALLHQVPLISRDRVIRAADIETIW